MKSLPVPFASVTLALALMAPLSALAEKPRDAASSFYELLDDTSAPIERLTALIADDYVDHNRAASAPAELSDRALFIGFLEQLRSGFPGMTHDIGIMEEIGEGRVVTHWTFRATQDGPFFGMPPSGKAVEIDGIDIVQIEGGKIAAMWHVEEQMALFEQLSANR